MSLVVIVGGIVVVTIRHYTDPNVPPKSDTLEPSTINSLQDNKIQQHKNIQDGDHLTSINMNQLLRERLVHYCDGRQNEILNKYKCTTVWVNNKFRYDYSVVHHKDSISLKAKNKKTAEWLIDQYISYLSYADTCIKAGDLPPNIIDFEESFDRNFDFVYREPHFSPNLEKRYEPYSGANSVEEYWDLWGHNLYDELNKYGLMNSAFIKGKTKQICFSEKTLFNNVITYLNNRAESNNYDKLRSHRFVIMPLDNMTACDCSLCRKQGNTWKYATPAIIDFLDRLTDKFPDYAFYTVAYHSTQTPPKKPPKHLAGVLLSTSDLPQGITLDPQNDTIKVFVETANAWKNHTDTLFVWDYAANFNDFLTPLPVLYVLKKKLNFYRDCGISGIFLQGSGYDYSPFDDVKTFVATALMINGQLDVDELCRRYFAHFYPVSAEILANYYLSMEKTMEQRGKGFDIHGNMNKAVESYFQVDVFLAFYKNLEMLLKMKEMDGDEKNRLEKLLSALSYTWLQLELFRQIKSYDITRINEKTIHITPETETVIKRLLEYKNHGFKKYKETHGELQNYLGYWNKYTKK